MKKYINSGLYYESKSWGKFILCKRSEISAEMQACLFAPDLFIDNGKSLKKGNSSTVSLITVNNKAYVIKRYNIKDNWHAVRRAFRSSRASISWDNAHMLEVNHILTAQPVALIENRCGILRRKSYFIMALNKGECCSDYFKSDKRSIKDKEKAADSIIKVLNRLKMLGITHGDLKYTNIIIENTTASLIDLDAMKQHSKKSTLEKYHKKDIKRFFLNWENDALNKKIFLDSYNNAK